MNRLDIVVFGATGFTGGFVVTELARVAAAEGISWGIAGRDEAKLRNSIQVAEDETGLSLNKTRMIIADTDNAVSLRNMCQQAKIILNCVGPYRFYGEPVVKACIATGTHHLDISGEPEYLEKMEYLYDTAALSAGVYIVGACGFDSIPADLGIIFTRDNFDGDLDYVEGFIKLNNSNERVVINYGTYESAVHSIANWQSLASLRRNIAQLKQLPPTAKALQKPPKRGRLFTVPGLSGSYSRAFGSDGAVVYRTQRYFTEHTGVPPIHSSLYWAWPSTLTALMAAVFGLIFMALAGFSLGRKLLLRYPGFFSAGLVSRSGPSRRHIDASSFSITFIGKGHQKPAVNDGTAQNAKPAQFSHDQKIVTRVRGPEVGYVTTVKCLVQAGVAVLKDKDRLPKRGGVFTPGAIFAKTNLVKRLTSSGVIFEVLPADCV